MQVFTVSPLITQVFTASPLITQVFTANPLITQVFTANPLITQVFTAKINAYFWDYVQPLVYMKSMKVIIYGNVSTRVAAENLCIVYPDEDIITLVKYIQCPLNLVPFSSGLLLDPVV